MPLIESNNIKIRTAVPLGAADTVRRALGEAGAGRIGNYSHCSFVYPVTGHFVPLEGADPAIGSIGKEETVQEVLIEAICSKDQVEAVYAALLEAHPYEEPAVDIMSLLSIE